MRYINFNEYFDEVGYKTYEEIIDWFESAPDCVPTDEFIYDIEAYALEIVEAEYEGSIGEYEDRCYDEYKDSLMMGED